MTQLLISVKNVAEAQLALAAGVDIIDLKDPNSGALGALDLPMTKEIVGLLRGHLNLSVVQISATVGEQHVNVNALMDDIQDRVNLGVDIIKIEVSDIFQAADFYTQISVFTKTNVKIVAVFFADGAVDLDLLPILKNAGFYGAMLDTKNKYENLLQVQSQAALQLFTQSCHQYQLESGLAGSLQPQHVDKLIESSATYIGFRGGVCENSQRTSALSGLKVMELVNMLRNGNKNHVKA